MKTKPLLAVLLMFPSVVATNIASAQLTFSWQNPRPQGSSLHDVVLLDSDLIVAVGSLRTVVHSTDGGTLWGVQHSVGGNGISLNGVSLTTPNNGWAVGSDGLIVQTEDGGSTWTVRYSGTTVDLKSISSVDEAVAFAVGAGGTIIRTSDGGETWAIQTSPDTNSLTEVFCVDTALAYAVGNDGTALRTTNSGLTWVSLSTGVEDDLQSCFFIDSNLGFAVGKRGRILRTTDGGTTWVSQTSGTIEALQGVAFMDVNTGAIVGDNATLLRTTNGGSNWFSQPLPGGVPFGLGLKSVALNGEMNGAAVGEMGLILKTTDGGATWGSRSSWVTTKVLQACSFVNPEVGAAVGGWNNTYPNFEAVHTTDGGESWSLGSHPEGTGAHDVVLLDDSTGYAFGGGIYRTTDDGATWILQGHYGIPFEGASFPERNVGVAVGSFGGIARTVDGGTSWTVLGNGTNWHIQDVFFVDAQNGWCLAWDCCGTFDTEIRHTTNGGTSWSVQHTSDERLWAVKFTDPFEGIIVGSNGTMLRTSDGGLTWSVPGNWTNQDLNDVFFVDGERGFATGNAGVILSTTDGGLAWVSELSPTRYNIMGVCSRMPGELVMVGENGSIFTVSTAMRPAAPALVSPPNGAAIENDSVMLVWRASSPEVDNYWIEYSTDATFSPSVVDSTVTDTSYVVRDLELMSIYYWRVRARNSEGWGSFSTVRNFTTFLSLPNQVQLLQPEHNVLIGVDSVLFLWERSEPGVDRYWLEHAIDPNFAMSMIDSTLEDTTASIHDLENRAYWWRVKAHNATGWGPFSEERKFTVLVTGVVVDKEIPTEFSLSQNYPNPFNPSTVIRYGLPERVHVRLEVFNVLGEMVAEFVNEEKEAGWHEVLLSGAQLSSGLYFYRLSTPNFVQTKKLVLVR